MEPSKNSKGKILQCDGNTEYFTPCVLKKMPNA